MKRKFWAGIFCTLCLTLFGCDYFNSKELIPGQSSSEDVRVRFGPPQRVWLNTDDTVTWEYSRQPQGTECYMITLDKNLVLAKIEQVLTRENLAKITSGMAEETVLRTLGKPGGKERFDLKPHEEVWSWRIEDTQLNDPVFFDVYFVAPGVVARTGQHSTPRK